MQLELAEGWYGGARRLETDNWDERPAGEEISLLVIHNISLPPGEFGGGFIESFFCNELDCDAHPWFENIRGVRVSAHLLIDRAGNCTQFVPFHRRAWHAGQSSFGGRENCNDFSIGVELEGTDDDAYTAEQYSSLLNLTRVLMRNYPAVTPARIAGHSDIAPGRKTDPGPAFDWDQFLHQLTVAGPTP